MKKTRLFIFLLVVILSSCLETTTDTAINKNGSGTFRASVDLSKMLQTLTAGKEIKKEESLSMDTTIYIRNHSDTSSLLTDAQKKLLHNMELKMKMEVGNDVPLQFLLVITTPFNSLEDLNALGILMKDENYDKIFDKAMKIPMLSGPDDEKEKQDNDNMFGSIFPGFMIGKYSKGAIDCQLDSTIYKRSVEGLKKMDLDIEGDGDGIKILESATFTNTITLPSKIKSVNSATMKQAEVNTKLIQTGNLLDLYKNPGNYAYNIKY